MTFTIFKRVKGVYLYLLGGYRTLSNWPPFIFDLIRILIGLRTKCKVYKLRDGTKIKVLDNSKELNYVFYSVFIKGEYDSMTKFKINKNDIVIDIGAHMGFFTIKAAKNAINGKVYAIEPFSAHFNILKSNIEQNGIKNVELYNEALSEKSGKLTFYYTREGELSDTSLFKINPRKISYEEEVKSISLNEFFHNEKIEMCNFMKLDCEGAEYSILMNADIATLNKIQKIAMEWHRFAEGHDPKKLADFLSDNGFRLIEPPSYDQIDGFLFAYR